jgi:Bacterial Ig domain
VTPLRGRRFRIARAAVGGALVASLALLPLPVAALGPVAGGPQAIDLLPPIGIPDTLTMRHDRVAVVPPPGVLGNDLDLDGGATAVLDAPPTHGTVQLRLDGGYTYTPHAGYVGTDQFRYHATGGLLNTLTTAVNITITNAVPVAVADAYAATAGTARVVSSPGVLANDIDADGDALTAALVTNVAHGTLSFAANGGFTYTATGGYAGPDAFTYRVSDGIVWSVPTTVALTVSLPPPTPTPPPTPAPTPTPILPTIPPSIIPTIPPSILPTLPPVATPLPTPTPRPTPGPSDSPRPSGSPDASASVAPAVSPGGPSNGPPVRGDGPFALPAVQIDPFDDGFGGFGAFGGFEWVVPAVLLAVPGLLLIVALLAQAAIGVIWLPMVRRHLAGVGLRRRSRKTVRG